MIFDDLLHSSRVYSFLGFSQHDIHLIINRAYFNFLQNKRMEQQKEVIKKEKETAEKIAAMAFAKSYLRDLVPTVFATLSDNGYFYDPVEKGRFTILVVILD